MILLPREMVGQFIDFVTTVYSSDVIHQTAGGEIARFMCQGRFFVIRNLEEDDTGEAPAVELWSNDLKTLEQVETRWNQTLSVAYEAYDFMDEDENEHGSAAEAND